MFSFLISIIYPNASLKTGCSCVYGNTTRGNAMNLVDVKHCVSVSSPSPSSACCRFSGDFQLRSCNVTRGRRGLVQAGDRATESNPRQLSAQVGCETRKSKSRLFAGRGEPVTVPGVDFEAARPKWKLSTVRSWKNRSVAPISKTPWTSDTRCCRRRQVGYLTWKKVSKACRRRYDDLLLTCLNSISKFRFCSRNILKLLRHMLTGELSCGGSNGLFAELWLVSSQSDSETRFSHSCLSL